MRRALRAWIVAATPFVVGFSPLEWVDRSVAENRAGNDEYRKGAFEEAAKRYSKGNAVDPGRPELLYNLGNALERMGKHPEAAAAYKQALDKAPRELSPDAWYNLGNSLLGAGNGQAAAQAYREALVRNPAHADAKRNLELALEQAKKQPPKPQNGKPGKNHKDDNDKKDEKKDEPKQGGQQPDSQNQQSASDSSSQPKEDEEKSAGEPKPDSQNSQQQGTQTAQNDPPPGGPPEQQQAAPEQSPPASKPPTTSAKTDENPSDLTREQAEGLLRSFEQMERRQLEDANHPKDQLGTPGGLDW